MTIKLKIYSEVTLGQGANLITVEKVNSENIYLRLQSNSSIRIIPTQLILDLLDPLNKGVITLEDINRRYRKEHNLPHLFDELRLNYDKYILGYDSSISKICEYELEHFSSNSPLPTFITLPKPFLLLAGISGTGKTRFVREQACRFQPNLTNYCLVPVRPD